MRLTPCLLALVSLCGLSAIASASNLPPETFYFNNTVLNNGAGSTATVTGSIVVVANYTNAEHYITSNNFTVSVGGNSYNFVSSATTYYFSPSPGDNAADYTFTDIVGSNTYTFNLVLEIFDNYPTPFNFEGATLCPSGSGCLFHQRAASTGFYLSSNNLFSDVSGTLASTPPSTAPTPEPSTFTLIGTGVAGLLGLARRRQRSA